MSTYTAPINALFETQRSAIQQSQRILEGTIEFQKSANRTALNGLSGLESTQRQGVAVAQAATRSYLSAVEAGTPGGSATGLQRNSDELFDRLKENHAKLFDAMTQEAKRSVDSFDDLSTKYVESLDEGLGELLDAHQRTQEQSAEAVETLEARTEEFAESFEEGMEEQMERAEEMQGEVEDQIETQAEQAKEIQEEFEAQLDEMQSEMDRQAAQMEANGGSKAGIDEIDSL